MICRECGEQFIERAVNQIYCSERCGARYRKKHPDVTRFPAISFECSQCGKSVVTDGKKDKRTRFCCRECEKKYWKHPPNEHSALCTMPASLVEWWEKHID